MLLGLLTHAQKECTHQLALPWGTRHLTSPKLAGKCVMILILQDSLMLCDLGLPSPHATALSGHFKPFKIISMFLSSHNGNCHLIGHVIIDTDACRTPSLGSS